MMPTLVGAMTGEVVAKDLQALKTLQASLRDMGVVAHGALYMMVSDWDLYDIIKGVLEFVGI